MTTSPIRIVRLKLQKITVKNGVSLLQNLNSESDNKRPT